MGIAQPGTSPSLKTLSLLAGEGRLNFFRKILVEKARRSYLKNGLQKEITVSEGLPWEDQFVSQQTKDDFKEFITTLSYEKYGILNTDALLLWGLVRTFRPQVLLESGTCYGYSTRILAEALRRYCPGAKLYTFSINRDNCLEAARRNLSLYPFVHIIEGETQKLLLSYINQFKGQEAAVFIDGPKGLTNAFPEVMSQLAQIDKPLFIACHDCQQSLPRRFITDGKMVNGYLNLTRIRFRFHYKNDGYRERGYSLKFMTNAWCEQKKYLDEPIYRFYAEEKAKGDDDTLKAPYFFYGTPQVSYGTSIGAIYRA